MLPMGPFVIEASSAEEALNITAWNWFEQGKDALGGLTKYGNIQSTITPTLYLIQPNHWEPLDLGPTGFTPGRWTQIERNYLGPEELIDWFRRFYLVNNPYAESGFTFLDGGKHEHSGCVTSASVMFKKIDRGDIPRVTMVSRTSRFPSTALLDFNILTLICRAVMTATGVSPEAYWWITMAQFSEFHGFPWFRYYLAQDGPIDMAHPMAYCAMWQQFYRQELKRIEWEGGKRFAYETSNRYYKAATVEPVWHKPDFSQYLEVFV